MNYKGLDIIENELSELNEFISKNITSSQMLISKAVRDLAEAGGKRIRPALTILVGRAFGHKKEELIPVAAAMEIIHMATLIHDDIIDDSNLRRNRVTVQSKYGKDIAVFTGDYLFSKAFLIISEYANKENLKGFARAVKHICEGEIEQYEKRFSLDVSLLQYLRRIKRKTGVLLALSCTAGILNKKVNSKLVRNLAAYGGYLGLAFQITDDILDFVGDKTTLGKPVGNDVKQGVYTLPLIYAMECSKRKDELMNILKKKNYTDEEVKTIIEIVKDSGGIEFSRSLSDRYISKGIKNIESLKNSKYKEALQDLIMGLNGRNF